MNFVDGSFEARARRGYSQFFSQKVGCTFTMGCCGSKVVQEVSRNEALTGNTKKRRAPEKAVSKAHTIELSDYEYSYTYSDSDDIVV